MLSLGFGFYSEWELHEKVDFDGVNKLIIVYPDVTFLDIREDVWSAWVRWDAILGRNYNRFLPAMERTGLDDTPSGQLGNFVFLKNDWKLLIDFSKVKVTGVLFSRDFDTAYYTYDLVPQFAVAVSNIVDTSTSVENVITATKEEIAEQVWANTIRTLTESIGLTPEQEIMLSDIHSVELNKRVTDETAKTITTYEDDQTTVHKVFDYTENADGGIVTITPQ